MCRYVFPGHPAFLAKAAEDLGLDACAAGRPLAPLASVASLCAQASMAVPEYAPAILREAVAYHDRLRIAARAAELMLAEVGRACGPPEAPPADDPDRPRPARRTGRNTTPRS